MWQFISLLKVKQSSICLGMFRSISNIEQDYLYRCFQGKSKNRGMLAFAALYCVSFKKKKYSCWSAMGNLNQFFFFFLKKG